MPPSKGPEWDQVTVLVTEWTMGPGLRGGSRCSASTACTSSLEVPPASGLAQRTQSLEQQDMAQPWVMEEEEEEEEEEGSSRGENFSDEDLSGRARAALNL